MSNKIINRPAKTQDSIQIASLCRQLGYPISAENVKERIVQIENNETNWIFVAENTDELVVGWVQVCVRRLIVAGLLAEIEGLVVDQAYRRNGVGRSLMLKAEAWARTQGCKAVFLRSNVLREGARPFYEGIGYFMFKEQWAFRKEI